MTNESITSQNNVNLQGIVDSVPVFSHELYGEDFYEFTLKVPRLSQMCDYIPITASSKHITTNDIKIGDNIVIDGQFRSYNKMEGTRSKLMLTVFVKELSLCDIDAYNPNTVELYGYICKEPIYRTTPFNREICDLLIAVNRAFNKSDYIPCITWGKNARLCKSFVVGTKIRITGRIQSRQYVKKISDDISETKTAYEVSVCKIENGSI